MEPFTITEGIWVAIIGGVFALIAALISRKSGNKAPAVEPLPVQQNVQTVNVSIQQEAAIRRDTPSLMWSEVISKETLSKETPSEKKITPITHADIVSAINAVPPFQQESIVKHYIGLKVCWRASLDSVSRYGKNVTVTATLSGSSYCHFECNSSEDGVAALLNTPKGGAIIVIGTLSMVGVGMCILDECVIHPVANV